MKQRAPFGHVAVGGSGPAESATTTESRPGFGDGDGGRVTVMLLTEPEVAERLRVSLACLRRWRLERRGPRFLKVGSLVRYPADELNRWIESLPAGGAVATSTSGARNTRRFERRETLGLQSA